MEINKTKRKKNSEYKAIETLNIVNQQSEKEVTKKLNLTQTLETAKSNCELMKI